jgi:hypothetical protein
MILNRFDPPALSELLLPQMDGAIYHNPLFHDQKLPYLRVRTLRLAKSGLRWSLSYLLRLAHLIKMLTDILFFFSFF